MQIITSFIKNNDPDLLVFYYPRDWQQGEIIWTPDADKIGAVQNKYLSASKVYSSSLENLQTDLLNLEICMIFLLIDVPQGRLMAYQHTKRNNFFTHKGVDKDFGAQQIANHLQFELKHSIGAGDSVDAKQKFLEGYEPDIEDFSKKAFSLTVFNIINYIPALQRMVDKKDKHNLALYKLRLDGSLDLFSL